MRQPVQDALHHYRALKAVPQRWVLVDSGAHILAEVPVSSPATHRHALQRHGVEIWTSTTIASVEADAVNLADGRRLDSATLVWTAGSSRTRWCRLGLPLDQRGRILVDSGLRVEGRSDIWALGDCAAVPNAATPGRLIPPTCQHAVRQARALAASLGGATGAYSYRSIGEGATLGRGQGVARVFRVHVRGRLGARSHAPTTSVLCPCAPGDCASSPRAAVGRLPTRHRRARLSLSYPGTVDDQRRPGAELPGPEHWEGPREIPRKGSSRRRRL